MSIVEVLKSSEENVAASALDAVKTSEDHIAASIAEMGAQIEAFQSHAKVALANAEKLTTARAALLSVNLHNTPPEPVLSAALEAVSLKEVQEALPLEPPAPAQDPYAPLHMSRASGSPSV